MNNILNESNKDRFILENPNLTEDQQQEIINFFNVHNDLHGIIKKWEDFKNYTYDDFVNVAYNRNVPKKGLESLTEGKDYDHIFDKDGFQYYFIYNYKASVVFASNNVAPEVWTPLPGWYKDPTHNKNWQKKRVLDYPIKIEYQFSPPMYGGAKWCISMNHTDEYWWKYIDHQLEGVKTCFVFVLNPVTKHKYAVTISTKQNRVVNIYDENDLRYSELLSSREMNKINNVLRDAIKQEIITPYIKKFNELLDSSFRDPENESLNKRLINEQWAKGCYELYEALYHKKPTIPELYEKMVSYCDNEEETFYCILLNTKESEALEFLKPEYVKKWVDTERIFKAMKNKTEVWDGADYYVNVIKTLAKINDNDSLNFKKELKSYLEEQTDSTKVLYGIYNILFKNNATIYFEDFVDQVIGRLNFSRTKFLNCFVNRGKLYSTENEILYTSLADNPLFAWLVYKKYSEDATSDYNMSVLFRL